MSRSLKVAPDNIGRVKLALKRCGFATQQTLANDLGIARATVSRFLNGYNVDFGIFEEICRRLGLDWEATAYYGEEDAPTETGQFPNTSDKPSEAEAVSTPHLDEAITSTSPKSKEKFIEAANNWDLERLYAELEVAKREWGVNRRWGLTTVEKLYLRGLLCGHSPDEIATELYKDIGLVRVQLSNGLYRYVEKLLERPKPLENWRDIVIWLAEAGYRLDERFEHKSQNASIGIDALVQEARENIKSFIKNKCSTVKVLKMPRPINSERIYTDLNFLEEMPGRRWIGIDKLQQGFNPDSPNLGPIRQGGISGQLIPGIEAAKLYDKLMVWGKPGSGKTTFLKHLAIQCIENKFQSDLVPIFISLDEFANNPDQSNLLKFIKQIFERYGLTENQITDLLNQGRVLILFDGFDEVKEKEDSNQVLADIRYLLNHFYKNRFVLTCRLAGGTGYGFSEFTEVEIADFDDEQIAQFANKWFAARKQTETAAKFLKETAAKFIKQLQVDKSIKELATNPLLLTMLCLVFEENAEFPKKRFDIYKEAIDIWLIKWDVQRGIERRQIYQRLELRGKRDLLSYIAYNTFEPGDCFFEKEKLEEYITDFLHTLPDAKTDFEALKEDSEKVLKAIEAQHGLLVKRASDIYSFSHIAFHEYFTAREIINSSDIDAAKEALQKLVKHITESRWREVFILVVGALYSAEYLLKLMKNQVDTLVAEDDGLQNFLTWVKDESLKVEISDNKTAIRAFYLDIDIDIDSERQLGYLIDFDCTCRLTYASFLAHALNECEITPEIVDLARKFDLSCVGDYTLEPTIAITVVRVFAINDLERDFGSRLKPEMKEKLQKLKEQMPNLNGDMESLLDWLKTHGKAWNKQVKDLIVDPYPINCHYPNLSEAQKELLKQYYNANRLLVECMNIANMSPEVRKEIKDSLLLYLDDAANFVGERLVEVDPPR